MRGEFGCDRILARFLEQDLKFESFGNLGLIYTLVDKLSLDLHFSQHQHTQVILHTSVREDTKV